MGPLALVEGKLNAIVGDNDITDGLSIGKMDFIKGNTLYTPSTSKSIMKDSMYTPRLLNNCQFKESADDEIEEGHIFFEDTEDIGNEYGGEFANVEDE
ncbi:6144_t:CDS:2, partial [Entrophospora sp. SA101]